MNRARRDARFGAAAFLTLAAAAIVSPSNPVAGADDDAWGDLTMQIVCRDVPHGLRRDDSLVVDRETGAVANVLVFILGDVDSVHESYGDPTANPVVVTFEKRNVTPRIAVARVSQTLVFVSNDDRHAPVFTPIGYPHATSSLLSPARHREEFPCTRAANLPSPVACAIHREESGFVQILKHPYGAVSQADGRLRIARLPVGTHEFRFWHERAGYVTQLRAGDDEWSLKRGLRRIEIRPGANDLGELVVPGAQFERTP